MKTRLATVIHLAFILFAAIHANAQIGQLEKLDQIYIWQAELENPEVPQGQNGSIILKLNIAEDHFTYREQTSFSVEPVEGIVFAEPIFPQPKLKEDPTDNNKVKAIYEGQQVYRIPFTVTQQAQAGEHTLNIHLNYQGCSQTICYFPQTRDYQVPLTVTKGAGHIDNPVSPAAAVPGPTQPGGLAQQRAQSQSDWLQANGVWALLIVFGTLFILGIATAGTPCVYPLIPITISILGAKDAKNIMQAFSLALTYVLGIVLMYSFLGYLAASTGAVFGQFMSNPWVMGGIAIIFAAMGASMLGAFELRLPAGLQAKLFPSQQSPGYGGAFSMGLVSGIIAAPCTGPVLAAVLAFVAAQAEPIRGTLYLTIYALGLGLPFLILGTFSGLIQKMPRSGSWMEYVKSAFGIILFAFALYFSKDAFKFLQAPLSDDMVTYIVSILIAAIGLGLGAVHLSFHTNNPILKLRKSLGVVLTVAGLYVLGGSLTVVAESNMNWHHDLGKGLAAAREQNKPVMIDFYADWCVVCKEIEAYTFSEPEVEKAMQRFVNIKVDLTDSTKKNQRIQQDYGIPGLPFIVFHNSIGEKLPEKTITGMIHKEAFLELVQEIE